MGRAALYVDRMVPEGTYTMVGSDGFNTTIEIQDGEWATKPYNGRPGHPAGTKVAALLIGPNNTRDFQSFAFIYPDGTVRPMRTAADRPMRALNALLSSQDPQTFGFEYALQSGRCFRCGRKLTVAASLHRGLGPDCAEIVGEWFAARAEGRSDIPQIPTQARQPEVTVITSPAAQRPTQPSDAIDSLEFDDEEKVIVARMKWGSVGFEDKKARVKGIGGRWNADNKTWLIRVNSQNVTSVCEALAVFVSWPDIRASVLALNSTAADNLAASRAKSSSFVASGIADNLSLRPFQAAGVELMVKQRRMVVADEMGLGKTIEFCAAIAHLGCTKVLIIPPATLKLNWKREVRRWVKGARVVVIEGGAPVARGVIEWATVVIVNYESADPAKHPWLLTTPWDAIGCDEAHYLKNPKAQRSKNVKQIVMGAGDSLKLVIALTGTPVKNKPLELYPLLELIGREDAVGGFWPFVMRYCNAKKERLPTKVKDPNTGKIETVMKERWNTEGSSNLLELHERLRSEGVYLRRVKEDVLTELPAKVWASVPMEMSDEGRKVYEKAEADTVEWMFAQDARLRKLVESAEAEWTKAYEDTGKNLGFTPQEVEHGRLQYIAEYIAERKDRSKAVEQLTKFEGLKAAAWIAKRESVIAWIDAFLEGSDRKLIVFANHIAVVDELADRYGAPKIQGGMDGRKVDEGKDQFQTDPNCRVIVCNIQAGGVGHTLTASSDVAFVEFAWTPADMDQAVDRAHRIGQTDSVTGWLLTASRGGDDEPTIDEIIADILEAKREVVNAVTDGITAGQSEDGAVSVASDVASTLIMRRASAR